MFTLARQRPRALIGLVGTALFLTGCAGSGTTTTETVTVTEATPSGDSSQAETAQDSASLAAPATFDRNDPNFEFFNICEELTNEDLAEVGLEFTDAKPTVQLDAPSSVCNVDKLGGWEPEHGIQSGVLSMNAVSESELLSKVVRIDDLPVQRKDLIFYQLAGDKEGQSCNVSGATSGGRLTFGYLLIRENALAHEAICETALNYFDQIRNLIEEKK